jgi:hypothetical protein
MVIPLIISNAYHKNSWEGRPEKKWGTFLDRS